MESKPLTIADLKRMDEEDEAREVACTHCGVNIASSDGKHYVHRRNGYNSKIRCDPEKSGQPYGLEATPQIELDHEAA